MKMKALIVINSIDNGMVVAKVIVGRENAANSTVEGIGHDRRVDFAMAPTRFSIEEFDCCWSHTKFDWSCFVSYQTRKCICF